MINLQDVMAWVETASEKDLTALAGELIERDFAADPEELSDLQGELDRAYEDDLDAELLIEVRSRLHRRDYREALHFLVIALGRDFDELEKLPLAGAA